ncbi:MULTISPECIES: hypothetical protein, partial [unclassified Streptomyces]|uniref:hypothetical protein n=1 Tax=unclassified Streptomyces TaxID=2593676 RepID=UPI001BED0EBD
CRAAPGRAWPTCWAIPGELLGDPGRPVGRPWPTCRATPFDRGGSGAVLPGGEPGEFGPSAWWGGSVGAISFVEVHSD